MSRRFYSYTQARYYWRYYWRIITNDRTDNDRVLTEFEDRDTEQMITRQELVEQIREAWSDAARLLVKYQLTDRYGVFVDIYKAYPAIYLRDRTPHMPPPLQMLRLLKDTEQKRLVS